MSMITTIKELLVAHKLFNKTITLEDVLSVKFDSTYTLDILKGKDSIEILGYYVQRRNSVKLYLNQYANVQYNIFLKPIKLNLYTSRDILDFLQIEGYIYVRELYT
jgi:hypothetical protein